MDKSPCLLEKYPITIWLFKIATDNGTFTHDLYDDLPIENGDLLIYDELFIKYPKKIWPAAAVLSLLHCFWCRFVQLHIASPGSPASTGRSPAVRKWHWYQIAWSILAKLCFNSLVSSILARKTGILLQLVRSTISGHVTTNPSTLDDGPTAVSLQQQALKFNTQPRLNCTSIRKPISPTSVLDPSRGHQKHQDGAPGYGSSGAFHQNHQQNIKKMWMFIGFHPNFLSSN